MAKREIVYYKHKYFKGSLTDDECASLLSLQNDYSLITDLKHIIYDVNISAITAKINEVEAYEREHGSVVGIDLNIAKEHKPLGTLTDEQTIGVAFMYYAKSAMLGDSTGKGKTVQVAGLCNVLDTMRQKAIQAEPLRVLKPFRFLFMTEKTAIDQIRSKMMQFTGKYVKKLDDGGGVTVKQILESISNGSDYSLVGTYSLLTNAAFLHYLSKAPFDMIIIDESTVVQNSKTGLFKNAKLALSKCNRRIVLNATPVGIDPEYFFWQLSLVDEDLIPSRAQFREEFCTVAPNRTGRWDVSGYKNEEFFREAISLRYLARVRDRVDCSYKVIEVPCSDTQKGLLRTTSLLQMSVDYPTGVYANIPYNKETTPKLHALEYILTNWIDIQDRALIYCRFIECQREMAEHLTSLGYRAAVLNGTLSAKERIAIIGAFNDREYDLLITNVQKGLDIRDCDNVIFYTIDADPFKMVQFEGRITREMVVESKNAYLLVASGAEKKKFDSTLKKRAEAGASFATAEIGLVLQALTGMENRVNFGELIE